MAAMQEEERLVEAYEGNGNEKHIHALTALKNLFYLLECHLPALHDYFCFLKASKQHCCEHWLY